MRLVIFALLLMPAFGGSAVAQEDRSTRLVLPHCVAGLEPDSQDPVGGRCAGIIATLSFVSRVLPDNLKFCQPSTATPAQIVQAIAGFVESNPDTGGQDFRLVALAAMRSTWPCRE